MTTGEEKRERFCFVVTAGALGCYIAQYSPSKICGRTFSSLSFFLLKWGRVWVINPTRCGSNHGLPFSNVIWPSFFLTLGFFTYPLTIITACTRTASHLKSSSIISSGKSPQSPHVYSNSLSTVSWLCISFLPSTNLDCNYIPNWVITWLISISPASA